MGVSNDIFFLLKAKNQASKGLTSAAHEFQAIGGSLRKTSAEMKKAENANRPFQTAIKKSTAEVHALRHALGTLGVGLSITGLTSLLDTIIDMENKIRLVTSSEEELNQVFKRLTVIARETRTPLDANAEAFRRIGVAVQGTGVSMEQQLTVLKAVNQSLIISGAGAQEARAGLIQLAQGLASNRLQGDELRSVLENIPRAARVIADELGVNIGRMRELAADGLITSDVVIRAFTNAADQLDREFGKVNVTIAQAFIVARNEMLGLIKTMNDAIPVGKALAGTIIIIADNLALLLALGAVKGIQALTKAWGAFNLQLAATQILTVISSFKKSGLALATIGSELKDISSTVRVLTQHVPSLTSNVRNAAVNYSLLSEGAYLAMSTATASTAALNKGAREVAGSFVTARTKLEALHAVAHKGGFAALAARFALLQISLSNLGPKLLAMGSSIISVANAITAALIPSLIRAITLTAAFTASLLANPFIATALAVAAITAAVIELTIGFDAVLKKIEEVYASIETFITNGIAGVKILTATIVYDFKLAVIKLKEIWLEGIGYIAKAALKFPNIAEKLGIDADRLALEYVQGVAQLKGASVEAERILNESINSALGFENPMLQVIEAQKRLAQEAKKAFEEATSAANAYLDELQKSYDKTLDNVAALKLVASGQAKNLEVAKLLVAQSKFKNSLAEEEKKKIDELTAKYIGLMDTQDKINEILKARDEAKKLREQTQEIEYQNEAIKAYIQGQYRSIEVAELELALSRAKTQEERNKIQAQLEGISLRELANAQDSEAKKIESEVKAYEDKNEQLRIEIGAHRLLLAGQAESLEIAKLKVKYESSHNEEIRGLIDKQIKLIRINEELKKQYERQKELADGIGDAFGNAFESIIKGADSLSNIMNNLAAEIADVIVQVQILGPLKEALASSGGSSFFGFGGSTDQFLPNLAGSFGNVLASVFKEGGHSMSPVARASVPISAFAGAPSYASGTSNSGGIPAILHPNEAVIPLSRNRKVPVEMAGGSGSAPIIINYNITTPDADSFKKSQNQILSQTKSALDRANRRNN